MQVLITLSLISFAFINDINGDEFQQPLKLEEGDLDIINSLSPYAHSLYRLLSEDGIFDTIYNATFTACGAKTAFEYGSLYFSQGLGEVNPSYLHIRVGVAAGKVFDNHVSTVRYFRAFSNTLETFLKKFLTPKTYQDIAHRHFELLKEWFSSYGSPTDATSSLHLLIHTNVKYFTELGGLSRGEILRMLVRATRELNDVEAMEHSVNDELLHLMEEERKLLESVSENA